MSTAPRTRMTVGFETTRRRRLSAGAWLPKGDFAHALVAMALTLVLVTLVLRLWRADISLPFDARRQDVSVYLMTIKGMIEHGWHLTNPDLGAPFGQELYDFAGFSGSNLHYAVMWIIGRFGAGAAVVMNLYYLLGFALTALAAFLVLRRLKISAAVAVACAIVFALLPGHFLHGEAHLGLASMFVIPVAAYLVLSVLGGRRLFAPRPDYGGRPALRYASSTSLLTLALAVLVGASDLYYASFTLILITVGGLLRVVTERRRAGAMTAAVLVAAIGGTLMFNLLPHALYRLDHAANPVVGKRVPVESEMFSLNVTSLVMPIDNHRLPPLAELASEYRIAPVEIGLGFPAGRASLDRMGLVASGGLLLLLGAALAACLGGGASVLSDRRLRLASVATLTTLLLATTGGFSALIAYVLNPQLRAWERAGSFIAFFSLVAVAVLLDRLSRRLRRPALLLLLALVVGFAVFDQTSNRFVLDYDRQAAEHASTDRLVRTLEARLPPGAMVFQLPYERFPESSVLHRRLPYDSVLPYLHSDDLRWSYGAMAFRPADWSAALAARRPADVLPPVAARGFRGILVDRFGYPDNGARAERALRRAIGVDALESADRRYAFFDLRAYLRRRGSTPAPTVKAG